MTLRKRSFPPWADWFKGKIRKLCLEGITVVSIARKTGFARRTVSDWKAGYAVPHERELKAICTSLGLNRDEIETEIDLDTSINYIQRRYLAAYEKADSDSICESLVWALGWIVKQLKNKKVEFRFLGAPFEGSTLTILCGVFNYKYTMDIMLLGEKQGVYFYLQDSNKRIYYEPRLLDQKRLDLAITKIQTELEMYVTNKK
jgi:transcriptional regulator with XRE-family HTH domain